MVTEIRRIQPGEEPSNDLLLTMTDRALEESYQNDQLRKLQQEVSQIPIPLPDSERMSKHSGNRIETGRQVGRYNDLTERAAL